MTQRKLNQEARSFLMVLPDGMPSPVTAEQTRYLDCF